MSGRSRLSHAIRAALVALTLTATCTSVAQDRDLRDGVDFRIRVQAALRLGRAGGAQAREELERGLRDVHPAVRVACAVSLATLGDSAAIPALEQASRAENVASAKAQYREVIEKLRTSGATRSADPQAALDRAKYVVQLGAMRNDTGIPGREVDAVMRKAARSRASSFKGAVILEQPDASVLKRAAEKQIPVLLLDGSLTRLTQSTARDGGIIVSAQVRMSIRRVPQQTLKGTVSGNASAADDARAGANAISELQNRAVGGAVESAMNGVGAEIATLAK